MSTEERPEGGTQAQVISSELVFQGTLLEVRVDEVLLANGVRTQREKVVHPGAVVVAAIDGQDRVAMVTQYRHAVTQDLLELPAGTLEDGEDPLPAARRELLEEVGVSARSWEVLGSFFSSPGFLREELHAFLARDLDQGLQELEEDEDIVLRWVPLQELLSGEPLIQDAKTLATLWLAARRLGAGA